MSIAQDLLSTLDALFEKHTEKLSERMSGVEKMMSGVETAIRSFGDMNELRRERQCLQGEVAELKVKVEAFVAEREGLVAKNAESAARIVELEKKKAVEQATPVLKGRSWEEECEAEIRKLLPRAEDVHRTPRSGDYMAAVPCWPGKPEGAKIVLDAKNVEKLDPGAWAKLSRDCDEQRAQFGVLVWKSKQTEPLVVDPRKMLEDQRTTVVSDPRLIGCNLAGLGQAMCLLLVRNMGGGSSDADVQHVHRTCVEFCKTATDLLGPLFESLPSVDAFRQMVSSLKANSRTLQCAAADVSLPKPLDSREARAKVKTERGTKRAHCESE